MTATFFDADGNLLAPKIPSVVPDNATMGIVSDGKDIWMADYSSERAFVVGTATVGKIWAEYRSGPVVQGQHDAP